MSESVPPGGRWFDELADTMGAAYLRYSFTSGTRAEVDAVLALTGLGPGARVLDVGCGPGRHARELVRRGFPVVGVDRSRSFVRVAGKRSEGDDTYLVGDARALPVAAGSFDLAMALCQGGFGLLGGPGTDDDPDRPDRDVLVAMAAAVRPGGWVVVSAFHAFFVVRHHREAAFDPVTGVAHEHTEIRDEAGRPHPAELWTTCYTPRELRLTATAVGLIDVRVLGVTPGDYAERPPDVDLEELLLVGRVPDPPPGGLGAADGTV